MGLWRWGRGTEAQPCSLQFIYFRCRARPRQFSSRLVYLSSVTATNTETTGEDVWVDRAACSEAMSASSTHPRELLSDRIYEVLGGPLPSL